MTAHVSPIQTMSFRARSLLAFVLEPSQPVSEWLAALDGWLTRSPAFFAAKPVILEMAGLDISLEEYRDLVGDLARRQIRVMAVENPSPTLVGPGLPPLVTGGRPVSAPPTLEEDTGPAAGSEEAGQERLADHRRQRPLRSIDHASRRRRDDSRPGRVGRRDRRGRLCSCLWRAARSRDRRGLRAAGARIFCKEARAEAALYRRRLSLRRRHGPKADGRSLEARLVGDGNFEFEF